MRMMETPNYPLLMASGVVLIAGLLVGGAAVTGGLPLVARSGADTAEKKTCANCGVITTIHKRGFYDVTVQMDDGRVITMSQDQAPSVAPGDRVRVNGDVLVRG